MLNYRIKTNIKSKEQQIKTETFGLSYDGTYIFGTTTDNIKDGDIVTVHIGENIEKEGFVGDVLELPIKVYNRKYEGYFEFENNETLTTISTYYYGNDKIDIQHNYCIINNNIYLKSDTENSRIIKYYFEDDKVTINEIEYTVHYKYDDAWCKKPYILYGGEEKYGILEKKYINEFIIRKEKDEYLDIDEVVYGDNQEYITLNGIKYICYNDIVDINGTEYTKHTEQHLQVTDDEGDYDIPVFIDNTYYVNLNGDKLYPQYEWVHNDSVYPYLFITLNNESNNLNILDDIVISRQIQNNKIFANFDGSFSINGIFYNRCDTPKKFVKIGFDEYELKNSGLIESTLNNTNKFYYVKNNVKFFCSIIQIDGAEYITLDKKTSDSCDYPINSYDYIIVNDIEYIIHKEQEGMEYIIMLNNLTYTFNVIDLIGRNTYICCLNSFGSYNMDINNIYKINKDIVINKQFYSFLKKPNTFKLQYNNNQINNAETYTWYNKIRNDIQIYVRPKTINIPIKINTDTNNSLYDEWFLNKKYGEQLSQNMVNTIVDMEQDIYSPATISKHKIISISRDNGKENVKCRISKSDEDGYVYINDEKSQLFNFYYFVNNSVKNQVDIKSGKFWEIKNCPQKEIPATAKTGELSDFYYIDNDSYNIIKCNKSVRFSHVMSDDYYAVFEKIVGDEVIYTTYYNGAECQLEKCKVSVTFSGIVSSINGVDGYKIKNKQIYGVETNNNGFCAISITDKEFFYSITSFGEEYGHFIIDNKKYNIGKKNVLKYNNDEYEIKLDDTNYVIYHNKIYEITSDDGVMLDDISQIKFYLHFRKRDLNTWDTIDDEDVWNIFTKKYKNKIKHMFCQPSDLLYFLNFTNSDIHYQKSKLGKSFIRLLYYDSPNIYNQNLLYTSTIFIDENKLFGKYCNNQFEDKTFYDIVSSEITNFSVSTEEIQDNKFTFDENHRLSSEISVENKHNAKISSDGFYLYLYKDLFDDANNVNTIYLKVQFNHAGNGKIIDFIFPYDIDENGCAKYVDLSDDNNLMKFQNGYSIRDELAEHMFLPIRIKGDKYYIDDGLCDPYEPQIMKLNLYEVKIKDELI